MSPARLGFWGLPGLPEVGPGDDLVALIAEAVEALAVVDPDTRPADGDIFLITSKIVSKAEGMQVPRDRRDRAIEEDTARVVAERAHAGGLTRIVETVHGLVLAAAGVDTSNVPDGVALRLPRDPDASARALCEGLRERLGAAIGVVITDTLGRPWRVGQVDIAIGAAGIEVVDDLRGGADVNGQSLNATITAVADALAGAADLVKGKTSGIPVAVARGANRFVTAGHGAGARALQRPSEEDLFRLGAAEAFRFGYETARRELAASDHRAARGETEPAE